MELTLGQTPLHPTARPLLQVHEFQQPSIQHRLRHPRLGITQICHSKRRLSIIRKKRVLSPENDIQKQPVFRESDQIAGHNKENLVQSDLDFF
jgi:hypothetical protein